MALLLITNPPTTLAISSDWTTFVTRSNANMLGHGLSIPIFTLTNWDATTTIPAIAEDSIIEVGGSFYQADADTALTPEGGIIDGTVHIKLVPAGGGASVVPTLTNDSIPAWDANKAGWYDTLDKFLPYEMTKATAVYTVKSEYTDQNKYIKSVIDSGGLNIDGTITSTSINTDNADLKMKVISGTASGTSINIAHGLTVGNIRGLAPTFNSSDGNLQAHAVKTNGANVTITLTGSGDSFNGTVYCVVFYV